jgi:hypothetical protein
MYVRAYVHTYIAASINAILQLHGHKQQKTTKRCVMINAVLQIQET